MIRMSHSMLLGFGLGAAVLLSRGTAVAAEGGGSIYPNGAESYLAGALPPPGLYGLVYAEDYRATTLRDNSGNDVTPPNFRLEAHAIAPRLAWVPGVKVFGGDLVLHAIVPLVDLTVRAGTAEQTKRGLGDITVGTGVGWHHNANWHSIAAVDFFLPTGGYSREDIANIGRNYYAAQAVYAITRTSPDGLNLDVKAHYLINGRNNATGYTSGQQFHADYALGWGLGSNWVVGIGGYYLVQTTDDRQNGQTVANKRIRAFSIGPSVKYDSGKGWFVTAKVEHEITVRNTVQGNAIWLKGVFPF